MKDTYEQPISTAVGEAYNRALSAFTGDDADVVERVQALQQADPEFALGHCLWGYVVMLSYNQATVPMAAQAVGAAAQYAAGATAREQSHMPWRMCSRCSAVPRRASRG